MNIENQEYPCMEGKGMQSLRAHGRDSLLLTMFSRWWLLEIIFIVSDTFTGEKELWNQEVWFLILLVIKPSSLSLSALHVATQNHVTLIHVFSSQNTDRSWMIFSVWTFFFFFGPFKLSLGMKFLCQTWYNPTWYICQTSITHYLAFTF